MKLNKKKTAKTLMWFAIGVCAFTLVAITDLHYVGAKKRWSGFDKLRVMVYLKTGVGATHILPNIKMFSMIKNTATLGNAFLNKELPDIAAIKQYRKILLNAVGNPNIANDSFREKLKKHEATAVGIYKKSGKKRYVNDVLQRVSYREYGLPFHDEWMVLLCTDIVNGKPKTSFLVWGMGVVTDERSPVVFGSQNGKLGKLIPLHWTNCLEREGLAKGFWTLLSETNETSMFSYTARYQKPQERKNNWLNKVKEYHQSGKGISADEL